MSPSPHSNMQVVASSDLATLQRYDSATIANVIELLKLRPNTAGYMNGSIRAQYPSFPPIVGFATTATFRSAYPSSETTAYRKLGEYVDQMQAIPAPRIVVIQDLDEPPAAAALGEIMCRAFKRFGCVGIITSGGTRDVLQVEELRFPVFASSVIVSHGYPHLEETLVPVNVGGLTVRPGDLLHADANGVVLIPAGTAKVVAETCGEFCAIERAVMEYLESESATPKEYSAVWEKAKKIFEQLSEKARGKLG